MTCPEVECACACGRAGCASMRGVTVHGPNGYRNGCRCEECVAGCNDRVSEKRRRNGDKTRATATRSGQQWTSAELEVATRDDLTAMQAAEMLGRTYQAVMNVRTLCRTDPKYIHLLGASRIERAS